MSREVHVRFCESRGVRFPSATHPPIRVSVPETPGSHFSDDSYILTAAIQPVETREGKETALNECCLEVDFPAGTYCRYG